MSVFFNLIPYHPVSAAFIFYSPTLYAYVCVCAEGGLHLMILYRSRLQF